MNRTIHPLWVVAASIALLAIGCRQEPTPTGQAIRPVKTIAIDARASGTIRTFAGAIVASETSALAFRIDGTVQTVDVDLGQYVEQGQTLAMLDRTPFQFRVRQALANVRNAEATHMETRDRRRRTRSLFEHGATSRATLDRVTAEDEAAAGALASARAAADLAQRDLQDTVLAAPFDGVVAKKMIEPFEEVTTGQTAFVLHTSGAVEIEVLVPETLIDRVRVDDTVSVRLTLTSAATRTFEGRVKEIGSAAIETSAFPVTIALPNEGGRLRPGLSAEVSFSFLRSGEPSWLVPINAFLPLPGDDQSTHISERELSVFVVDPASETVSRRRVKPQTILGNDVLVSAGLSEGDRVVVAGVSFLHEGQKVRLVESPP
jgi:RND family efflux transporter MFP subunit